MVTLNEMTRAWSLYLSLCVIVIFSNAAVLRSQTEHWTTGENVTEIATTPFRSTIIVDSKNVSSSTASTIIDDRLRASATSTVLQQSSQDGRIVATSTSTFTPRETTTHPSTNASLATTSSDEALNSTPSPRQALVTGRTAAITLPSTRRWTTTRSYDLASSLSVANFTLPKTASALTVSRGDKEELTSPLSTEVEYDQTTRPSSSSESSSSLVFGSTSSTSRTTNGPPSGLNTTHEVVQSTESTLLSTITTTSSSSSPVTTTASNYPNTNLLGVPASDERRRSLNKERSQFPGITLKVSHVLIPKQKRSGGYGNAQNLRIELPALRSAPKTGKRSNCTRFPVQVVTAADTESNEKVNLTEEHYDCEFSSDVPSTQKKEDAPVHTYYGGYVFRYTIPKAASVKNSTESNRTTWTESARTREMTTVAELDDYDSSYVEYSDTSNSSVGNTSGVLDDEIFPEPIFSSSSSNSNTNSNSSGRKQVVVHVKPEAYNSPTSDDSMLDNDFHDHDVIDSVMYIYFGGAPRGQKGAGRQIIIVGAVIALIAQFLTLASSLRRIKTHKGEAPTVILLNVETALTLTNLIFILGVQSTSNHTQCGITAVALYYLHLVILIWFWLSSVYCVQVVCQIKPASCELYKYCLCGWLLPLVITSLNYFFNERSFETSSYCWVSPLKGVLVSFILPVILLTLMCVALTVYGLKHGIEPLEDVDDTYSLRKLLRIVAVSLPVFSVTWFTGMVALENSASLLYSLIFLISDTVLNWLLFACWLPSEASQWKDMDEDYYDEDEDYDDEPVMVKRRFDDQPLLSELYEYGAQGQLYNMKVEPISIIHTP